jgi:transcriptional regulator with PAS, ATPase and Fis domain
MNMVLGPTPQATGDRAAVGLGGLCCLLDNGKLEIMNDHANLARAATIHAGFGRLIGASAPMRRLFELITKASRCTSPVLLTGETGTGKELAARAIHSAGSRREKALVPVDCSALTPTLVEAELFGHVKGAFTGADSTKPGLLQAANEGTIFLDEIGELPIFLQAKLLRTLQEKEVRPIGSTERIPVNARVIAATNRDLEAGVRAGTFRQDLYFRLNVVQIRLPTLRERKIDIPLLVAHFLDKFSDPLQLVRAISDDALRRLMDHDWPGNVRELENVIESAVVLGSESILTADDLAALPNGGSAGNPSDSNQVVPLAEVERRAIMHALREDAGNKPAAAHHLGISRGTLYRKLKEYSTSHELPYQEPQEEH